MKTVDHIEYLIEELSCAFNDCFEDDPKTAKQDLWSFELAARRAGAIEALGYILDDEATIDVRLIGCDPRKPFEGLWEDEPEKRSEMLIAAADLRKELYELLKKEFEPYECKSSGPSETDS